MHHTQIKFLVHRYLHQSSLADLVFGYIRDQDRTWVHFCTETYIQFKSLSPFVTGFEDVIFAARIESDTVSLSP